MLSARKGCARWSAPSTASGSKKVRARSVQNGSHCIAAGVHGLVTSASPLTRNVPPVVTAATSAVVGAAVSAGALEVDAPAPDVAGAAVATGTVASVAAPPSSFLSLHAAASTAKANSATPRLRAVARRAMIVSPLVATPMRSTATIAISHGRSSSCAPLRFAAVAKKSSLGRLAALRVKPGASVDLGRYDTDARFGWHEESAEAELQNVKIELDKLQQRLYDEGQRSLLLVTQARDAAGKDGTIRSIFSGLN